MDIPVDPNVGGIIRGYQLEKVLGTGKLTTLYSACTEELWLPPELIIMLFHIPPTLTQRAQERFRERFAREASFLMRLRHPSLHPLFGYGEEAGQLYLLFPSPASGSTLARCLQTQRHWSLSEIFTILAPLCSALDYIHHQGLAYKFFTPTNILLQENAAPQITGLGLLQLLLLQGLDEEAQQDETNRQLKNIANDSIHISAYLAPELVRGEQADKRADIYTLGIILFELLSGKLPFTDEENSDDGAWKQRRQPLPSLHAVAPDIPIALELIVNQALHHDPEHRFASAGDLINSFSYVLNERLRTPAYLSNELSDEQKQAELFLPSRNNTYHMDPSPLHARGWHSKGNGTNSMASDTSIDLPISSAHDKRDSTTPTSFDRDEMDNATSNSFEKHTQSLAELSSQSDMDKMAQHIQQLRQRIQGRYHK